MSRRATRRVVVYGPQLSSESLQELFDTVYPHPQMVIKRCPVEFETIESLIKPVEGAGSTTRPGIYYLDKELARTRVLRRAPKAPQPSAKVERHR